jgi:hypothetical protein
MASFENDISNSPGANPLPATAPDQQAPLAAQDSSATTSPSSATQAQPATTPSGTGTQQSQAKPQNDQTMVSNTPPPDPVQDHPLVKKAGILHAVATALAGGQRYTERIDDNGERVRTPVKMSGGQIGLAIALEAISGSLTGLAAGRGRGPGAAGAAAFAQAAARRQQEIDRVDQKAQEDYSNRAKAIASKAQIAEVNSRTLLNTAESEKYGAEAIDKLVEINRGSVLDIDPALLENNGEPMTQQELLDGMKAGKISGTDHLGPVVGRVEVTDRDGTKRWETTHLVIKDSNSPVTLTQEAFDRYAAGKVPGFPAGVKIGAGTQVKLATIQHANEVLAAHTLSDFRLKDMKDVLAGTQFADKVPASIDFSKPGVETAMQKFQKYVSHSNAHGMDILESLQAMGADKRDEKTGQMRPNQDAKYVDVVAGALGGYPVLEAVHNQLAANKKVASEFSIIDSEAKANAVIATPSKFTQDQVSSAKSFLTLTQQQGARKAAEDARARAVAEGKDTEAMFKTGVNPITGERLSLSNAPDSMFVDSKGRPVPQNEQSFYKPSQNERQTADTARQALAISADLRAAVAKNPNLVGPLLGNSKEGLAKLGFGTEQAQKFLDDINFLQSAATKVHTGRFSSEILHKMGNMVKSGMNPQQFVGGLNSIDEVMNRYAQEDKLITVADYKAMQQAPASAAPSNGLTNLQINPQTKQQIGWDGKQWVDASTGQAVK